MDDVPDVRSVDPHPERHGRHDDVGALLDEGFLMPAPHVIRQACVIRQRGVALLLEPRGKRFDLTPRRAVDDAGLAIVPREDPLQLRVEIAATEHAVDEIRAIERSDEHGRILESQLGDDVAADAFGGGRGVRVQRHARKVVARAPELPVLRPEIVAPLTDAVGFVDRDEADAPLLQRPAKTIAALADEPLGRDVEQATTILAQAREHGVAFGGGLRAVQERCRHAVDTQAVDLILHQ